jgi:hypothetical protein
MARVITLEGLANESLPRRKSRCKETVMVYSPILGEEVPICKEDFKAVASRVTTTAPTVTELPTPRRRGRGRPKGSTIRSGAKKPSVKSCKTPVWVTGKSGKKFCRCRQGDNTQILPHSACGKTKNRKKGS